MKKYTFLIGLCIIFFKCLFAQNVGINTPTPSERLDVNGNVNIAGQLKLNGNAGQANQVLIKNGSNIPTWIDLSEFKNMQVYDNMNFANTAGANNLNNTFTVPAAVTTLLIECWGGGSGGGYLFGGAGGGYVSAKITVTPGASVAVQVGAGGLYASLTAPSIVGGNSSVTSGGIAATAFGGNASPFVAGAFPNVLTANSSQGGGFFVTGSASQSIGYFGGAGNPSKISFSQLSSTEFVKIINYGNGGDSPLLPGSGGLGGYELASLTYNQRFTSEEVASRPGGGGGADYRSGGYGRGGRVIIRW